MCGVVVFLFGFFFGWLNLLPFQIRCNQTGAAPQRFFPPPDNLADDKQEHTSGSWLRFKKHYTIKSTHLSNLSGNDAATAQSDGISDREYV